MPRKAEGHKRRCLKYDRKGVKGVGDKARTILTFCRSSDDSAKPVQVLSIWKYNIWMSLCMQMISSDVRSGISSTKLSNEQMIAIDG